MRTSTLAHYNDKVKAINLKSYFKETVWSDYTQTEMMRIFYLYAFGRVMFITYLLFYFLLPLTGIFSIITSINALCAGEFCGHRKVKNLWPYRAEAPITQSGGIYLILMYIWFLCQ
ncbi:TPA: hypothetical protein OUA31_002299 [Klebsiella aerogenes]|nr:hypothetical protein [Klebsiella aerogenes]HCT8623772.1 hypothetical protein [Klebsiella aerogenes]HCT8633635.1 hypothetical protein [Klebsiella aerogenes]HCT8714145.1 hypothetical protein [Klebsiella aerogenes]HDT2543408.1 hypothetical protein [Klebsiella aerogenes]